VFVVHGFSPGISPSRASPRGLDDLSTDGASLVVEGVRRGTQSHLIEYVLRPEDAGLTPSPAASVAGEGPVENALALRRLLCGGRDSDLSGYRMAVQYAGGLSLLVAGDDGLDQLPHLAARIGDALDDGTALGRLDALVARTQDDLQSLATSPS
jgi:anthranilate phosphoribosyltransferase